MPDSAPPITASGPALPGRALTEQQWRDALFVHWRVSPDRIAPLLPVGTQPDVLNGSSWIGLIAFRMVGLGLGAGHGLPWIGTFVETNVRVYTIDEEGRRGVVFLTLECDRLLAVVGARAMLNLKYRWAAQSFHREQVGRQQRLTYTSRGRLRAGKDASWRRRTGITVLVDQQQLTPSPTERFLTARFGLHQRAWNRTLWLPNTHQPWPLQRAHLVEERDELIAWCGLSGITDDPPESVLYSSGVRTSFGAPQVVPEVSPRSADPKLS